VLPLLPAAIRFDNRAQRGTPKRWPEVGRYLAERTGHNFPVLAKLHSSRARRAVASMLRENLDPASSVIGLADKVRAGAIFATVVENQQLLDDIKALARAGRLQSGPRRRLDGGRMPGRRPDRARHR
jgi:hypothetical protein